MCEAFNIVLLKELKSILENRDFYKHFTSNEVKNLSGPISYVVPAPTLRSIYRSA